MAIEYHSKTEAPLPPMAVSALLKGRKIEAIKIVRKERGIDLKDAKAAVDAYIQSDSVLQEALRNAHPNTPGMVWFLLAIGLGLLAWYFSS